MVWVGVGVWPVGGWVTTVTHYGYSGVNEDITQSAHCEGDWMDDGERIKLISIIIIITQAIRMGHAIYV